MTFLIGWDFLIQALSNTLLSAGMAIVPERIIKPSSRNKTSHMRSLIVSIAPNNHKIAFSYYIFVF